MTESEMFTELKAEIVAQVWGSSSNVVFPTGCVAITVNADLAMVGALKSMRTPWCLLQPLDSVTDPEFDEDPNVVQMNLLCRIMVSVPGDAVGENPLMGANKTGGSTKSEGRGLFEIEQELFNAIGKVNALEGVILQCRQKGAAQTALYDGGSVYVAFRDFRFEALGTLV
jgi:hypothetical protein